MNDNTPTLLNTLIGITLTVWVVFTGAASLKFLMTDRDRPIINSAQTCTTFLWGGCTANNAK